MWLSTHCNSNVESTVQVFFTNVINLRTTSDWAHANASSRKLVEAKIRFRAGYVMKSGQNIDEVSDAGKDNLTSVCIKSSGLKGMENKKW